MNKKIFLMGAVFLLAMKLSQAQVSFGIRAGANYNKWQGESMQVIQDLVDKTDGSTDGIPEFILGREYILPWVQLMHRELERLRTSASDIDAYGATNEAEFFAVVSEYFFERPELLKAKHPELYALLSRIFGGAGHGSGS